MALPSSPVESVFTVGSLVFVVHRLQEKEGILNTIYIDCDDASKTIQVYWFFETMFWCVNTGVSCFFSSIFYEWVIFYVEQQNYPLACLEELRPRDAHELFRVPTTFAPVAVRPADHSTPVIRVSEPEPVKAPLLRQLSVRVTV